jgi:hypothetical protein
LRDICLKYNMCRGLRAAIGLLFALGLQAQDIDLRLYSEFQRVNASGEVIEPEGSAPPQEIISPAVVRNGFTTFQVVVTARPRILYWFAIQTNPSDFFRIKLYKEQALQQGSTVIPDGLVERTKPSYFLGVMPDVPGPRATEVYLLDIWTPADAPVGRVRFEVLVKTAYWTVSPMEVRVLPARVPNLASPVCCVPLPAPQQPADSGVWGPLFGGLHGGTLPALPLPETVRSVIRRNAIQDAALARSFDQAARSMLFERLWPIMANRLLGGPVSLQPGTEAYLTIRQKILKTASDLVAGSEE